jgi:hypothetical protein
MSGGITFPAALTHSVSVSESREEALAVLVRDWPNRVKTVSAIRLTVALYSGGESLKKPRGQVFLRYGCVITMALSLRCESSFEI